MINILLQNIDTEYKMLAELSSYLQRARISSPPEQKLLLEGAAALQKGIKIINSNVPALLTHVPTAQRLPALEVEQPKANLPPESHTKAALQQVRFRSVDAEVAVTLQERDRERFLKELSVTEQVLRKIKQKPKTEGEVYEEFKAARGYLKLANRLFLPTANNIIDRGYFKVLAVSLRKANLDILFGTYVAMLLFTAFVFFFIALFAAALLFFLNLSLLPPYISAVSASSLTLTRFVRILLIPILTPAIVFLALYYYPSSEKSAIAKKIEQEIPFAVIHMSAISGSGIEPTQIFKIIGMSKEYPALRKEIRKVINQINLYGYDLITSLNQVAATTPSIKLAELFAGVSTTITSGGDLSSFFEKRAETLLISYRLEREKFTKLAETFMDVYISLVIAAPMILMIILVLISVSSLNTGLSPLMLTIIIIFVIGVLNALFIGFLHLKQPTY